MAAKSESLSPGLLLLGSIGGGMMLCGLIGSVVGFLIGLRVYVPTAGAAAFEIGAPAAAAGGILGALVGLTVLAVRRAGARRAAGEGRGRSARERH